VALFFTYPLGITNKWAKNFTTVFPKLLLPLVILMFMSLWIRISSYGITHTRYFLVIAAIWITFSLIYLSIKKNPKNIILPICLSVLLFLSATGPWNFSKVTQISQTKIFNNIIVKYDMLEEGKIVATSKQISTQDRITLTSIVNYYQSHYNLKSLEYLPNNFTIDKMKTVFGFEPEYYQGYNNISSNHRYYNLKDQNSILDIKGYNYIVNISNNMGDETIISKDSIEIVLNKSNLTIKNKGKMLYNKNISDLVSKIYASNNNKDSLTTEELTIKDGNENLDLVYVFNNIELSKDDGSDIIQIYNMNVKLLIKLH